jgi:4-hydroxy-3-polyprenylbenzoate decarboxylase
MMQTELPSAARDLGGEQRKVFLFDRVVSAKGNRYEMAVAAGVYGASREILAMGMQCDDRRQMLEKWHHALTHTIEPVLVSAGPVHEEIHLGDELATLGLDELPVPVEEPGFSGMLRTGTPMITKDPVTGVRNVGTYNGFLRARDRMVAAIGPSHHAMLHHWQSARRRNEPLPVAIVVGATPNIMLVGSASLPYGTDELAVAGGIAGEPVELVRCKTVPLEVPANTEIVIEGLISTTTSEPRTAFGEYPGYLNMERNVRPVLQVTAITHRKGAIFTPLMVGFPPSDTNLVWGFCNSAMLYHHLKYQCRFPVRDVWCPEMGGGNDLCVIRIEESLLESPWQVLQSAAGTHQGGKLFVAVDSDIDPDDPYLLLWALSFRMRPEHDLIFTKGRTPGLDPSAASPGAGRGKMESAGAERAYSRILIDATRKWPYPPLALPRKEFMDGAAELWRRQKDLPDLHLKEPWCGTTLGVWSDDDQENAELIARGEYLKVGEKMAALQTKVTDSMVRGRQQ